MHFGIAILVWAALVLWVIRASSGLRSMVALRANLRSWARHLRLSGIKAYVVGGVVLVLVCAGIARTAGHNFGTGAGRGDEGGFVLPPLAQRLPPTPLPGLGTVKVRVVADTELRNGPSPYAPSLRMAHRDDVLTEFSTANGWVQVGTGRPEGWVAGPTVEPDR